MNKRLIFQLLILVVVAAAAAYVIKPFGLFSAGQQDDGEGRALVLCDFKAEAVSGFQISQPEKQAFNLVKEGGEWYLVQGEMKYPANMDRVDRLLELVPGLASEGLATDKLDKHATMEVDEAKGIGLSVYTGGEEPSVKLMVGKSAPGFSTCFVRFAAANEVYRAGSNIKSLVGFDFKDFRSRKPWSFDPLLAEEVVIRPPGEDEAAQTFTREEGFWKTADGANANQNLLTTLVDAFSKVSINEFVDEPEEEEDANGISAQIPNLAVKGPEGEYSLYLVDTDGANFRIADQDGYLYQLSEFNLKFYNELAFDQLAFDDTASEAEDAEEAESGGSW
ncbi:DUF4340 domain-containing protein [bacterium]|nr:DUF4340 domain-containing protein [bacterium]